jgi:hypothetical protein
MRCAGALSPAPSRPFGRTPPAAQGESDLAGATPRETSIEYGVRTMEMGELR